MTTHLRDHSRRVPRGRSMRWRICRKRLPVKWLSARGAHVGRRDGDGTANASGAAEHGAGPPTTVSSPKGDALTAEEGRCRLRTGRARPGPAGLERDHKLAVSTTSFLRSGREGLSALWRNVRGRPARGTLTGAGDHRRPAQDADRDPASPRRVRVRGLRREPHNFRTDTTGAAHHRPRNSLMVLAGSTGLEPATSGLTGDFPISPLGAVDVNRCALTGGYPAPS